MPVVARCCYAGSAAYVRRGNGKRQPVPSIVELNYCESNPCGTLMQS